MFISFFSDAHTTCEVLLCPCNQLPYFPHTGASFWVGGGVPQA